MSKIFAIIPAGGTGTRVGGEIPKQYLDFHGKELIAYTLEIFQNNDQIDEIAISAQPRFFELLERIKNRFGFTKVTKIVEGGENRQISVYNALISLDAADGDLICVHDAARPLLPAHILDSVITDCKKNGNAVLAIKAKDTLVNGLKTVDNYINRGNISYIQTPQIFEFSELLKAMKNAAEEGFIGTDESMLVYRLGKSIYLSEGSSINFKVTTEADVELVKLISGKKKKGM